VESRQFTLTALSTYHRSPRQTLALSTSAVDMTPNVMGRISANTRIIGSANCAMKKTAPRIPATRVNRRLDASERYPRKESASGPAVDMNGLLRGDAGVRRAMRAVAGF